MGKKVSNLLPHSVGCETPATAFATKKDSRSALFGGKTVERRKAQDG